MLRLKPSIDLSKPIGEWTPEPDFRDKVTIEGLTIFLSGIQANHPEFGGVTGSAADVETHPIERSWYELVERISILNKMMSAQSVYQPLSLDGEKLGKTLTKDEVFPSSTSPEYQYARSNGVALHKTWEEACRRAAFELVERHLVLSSWVGLVRPLVTMEGSGRSALNSLRQTYEVKRVHFGTQSIRCLNATLGVTVSAVALLPRDPAAPLILAFGAAETSKESLMKAEAEAIQRLGFLWGEELPTELPEFSPTNLYHQDYFLRADQRDKVEAWLNGVFYRGSGDKAESTLDKTLSVSFVDLSAYPELNLKVARAICPEMIPLVFGKWREREFANLPDALLIHPIA